MLFATEVITVDTIINIPYSLCLVSKHTFIFISSRVLKIKHCGNRTDFVRRDWWKKGNLYILERQEMILKETICDLFKEAL